MRNDALFYNSLPCLLRLIILQLLTKAHNNISYQQHHLSTMDSPVATANMPAASAHFAARKVKMDLARAESVRIMKANAPAATQYFGKINDDKKAEKEAKLAKAAAKYEAPAATQYFNAKKAASTRNLM